jgi:hypothetical protein
MTLRERPGSSADAVRTARLPAFIAGSSDCAYGGCMETTMRLPVVVLAAIITVADIAHAGQATRVCAPSGTLVSLPGLPEASGLAASQRTPGRFWTHNDSGQPVLFALDTRGTITGQLRVTGAKVEDWEALAIGPCEGGSCLYIGDIGDNDAERRRITVYRVPEPEQASGTAEVAETIHATYPDGAKDAETLFVAGGRLHIVTKGENGPVAIYRFPATVKNGSTVQLERVGGNAPTRGGKAWITDGSVSPDGQWVALRSRSNLTFYRASDVLAGNWREASTVDLTPLKEPQGEGIELGPDDTVYLAGEGGGKGRAGTFVRFACAPAATMR